MPKKQDTNTKYLDIKINSKELFILEKILKNYILEMEALAYLDTNKIDAKPIYDKVKHLIALYELKNPGAGE
jgi:hypothetical protein